MQSSMLQLLQWLASGGGNGSVVVKSVCLPIERLGVRSTATEEIAVALLGQVRSPQLPQQGANFWLRPPDNCHHQKYN